MNAAKGWAWAALIATLGVALPLGLQHLTGEQAARQAQTQQSRALLDLLPDAHYDNAPLAHPLAIAVQPLANSQLQGGYLATLSGHPSALLLRLRADGYIGPIELLVAIDRDGQLLGVKTLVQSETPNIGGLISEHGNLWMAAFKGHSRDNPPPFDHMAGATVTSRAVTHAVQDALRYFDEHRSSLLERDAHE